MIRLATLSSFNYFIFLVYFIELFMFSDSTKVDIMYPGTALTRLSNVQKRVKSLSTGDLSQSWEVVRKKLLWAAGLKDLRNVR